MGTLTLATIRNNVRSELNETTEMTLTNTELNAIANDGYKDVCAKGMGYENKIAFDNIAAQKVVPLIFATNKILKTNYVEYKSGATEGGWGMISILPQAVGYPAISASTPKHWFQWGDYLVVEPIPDAATYDLATYNACYPATVLSADGDLPSALPAELHECVYLFTLAFAALKLKRWGDAANAYNRYIFEVQRKRQEYILKQADPRASHDLPDSVEMKRG